jgi:2,3-bisphosphoglycerate-independent phosphoglycerate mutase
VLKCQYATEHRCGVLIRGPSLTSRITGTDPLKDNLKALVCEPIDKTNEAAILTSKIVNAASKEITRVLTEHPINVERRS